PEYFRLMKERFEVLADGIGLVIAGKLTGQRLRENINGSDMYPHLCEMAEKNGFSIYLLGARPGVAETMRRKTLESYPLLKFAGVRDGCFDLDAGAEQVVAAINASGADILLVAFGVPRQEKWLERWGEQLAAPVRIGVGGLFDFYSGRIRRAPLWMREIGMEWSFRLLMEPRRLFKRYIIGNPLFLWRVVRRQLSRR
ncbi:MAG: glycosyltransferase, partial [Lentisphaerae bacterium]